MAKQAGTQAGEQKVESVERALTILEAFADGSPRLTLNELAQRTGLYRSTILRLAASLERFGYMHRGEGGLYRLGPSLWRLGVLYQNAFNLSDYVRPVLQRLVDTTGETAAFYIRDGNRRICLYRQQAKHLIRLHLEEGAELPLDRGASARILMAHTDGEGTFYERVRQDGYYISLGERDPETIAIAAPVFGIDEKLVGALGIVGLQSRFAEEAKLQTVELLVRSAGELSRTLGRTTAA